MKQNNFKLVFLFVVINFVSCNNHVSIFIYVFIALKAPNITKEIPNMTVLQEHLGGNVELFCDVTGNPEPTITWYFYKDGKGVRSAINRQKYNLGGNKDNCRSRRKGYYFLQPGDARALVICNPEFENHQGKYMCHAKNTVGEQSKSAFVNVESK